MNKLEICGSEFCTVLLCRAYNATGDPIGCCIYLTIVVTCCTDGTDIHWILQGTEIDGEYQYEAVSVMAVYGEYNQGNSGGGFEVQGGAMFAPPDSAELQARIREFQEY